MSKSALAVGVLMLLALVPVALAAEGFRVTVRVNGNPQQDATVVLWRNYETAGWSMETQEGTAGNGMVDFYHDNPVGPCNIPYTTEHRKLRAWYEGFCSPYSQEYTYDGSEDYYEVTLDIQTE